MIRPTATLLVCALLISCRTGPARLRPAAGPEGVIYVYLQPAAPSAERIRFRIDGVSALGQDGSSLPLRLLLGEVDAEQLSRERLLAAGPLPSGNYSGLLLTVGRAALRGDEGDTELLVPDAELRVELPFTMRARRAFVVTARFHDQGAIDAGYRFAPAFSAEPAPASTTGLVGLALGCESGTLAIFDKLTGRVSSVLLLPGRRPGGSAVDPRRLRAYVPLADEDRIEVVDLQQYRAIEKVRLTGGDRPTELALTPDGGLLLAVNSGSDTLSLIDPGTLSERERVPVGDEPTSLSVGRSGRRAYVLNSVSGTISVVDLTAAVVAATIGVEADPIRSQLNRRGDRLYVIHGFSPYLTVLDTASLEIVERVYVGSGATALKVDPRSDRIYLALGGAPRIEVYDPFSLLPVDSIPVDGDVSYMTIDDEGNNLVLVLESPGQVRLLRLVGHDTVARIDVDGRPCWVSLLGER